MKSLAIKIFNLLDFSCPVFAHRLQTNALSVKSSLLEELGRSLNIWILHSQILSKILTLLGVMSQTVFYAKRNLLKTFLISHSNFLLLQIYLDDSDLSEV